VVVDHAVAEVVVDEVVLVEGAVVVVVVEVRSRGPRPRESRRSRRRALSVASAAAPDRPDQRVGATCT